MNTGDLIHASVVGTACVGNSCTWTISAVDQTTGASFNSITTDNEEFDVADGGDVEVHDITSCDQLPVNGVSYTNISVINSNGVKLTSAFSRQFGDTTSPSCGYAITTTATTVHDFHNPSSDTIWAAGGLKGSDGCVGTACASAGFLTSITASGNVITLKNKFGATGTIQLHGATATGGLTASCGTPFCTGPQPISTVTVSGKTLTIHDAAGHSGTITLAGATLTGLSRGQTAFCGGITCSSPAQLTEFSSWGASGISTITDSDGNDYFIKFQ